MAQNKMYRTIAPAIEPIAYVTKSKQRLKQHENNVYLNNGETFEIELFNPTQGRILAKIELNGKSIGPGLIIRPGERTFLERYLDDKQGKFLFETYEVSDLNNDTIKNAIQNNGTVSVKFFKEEQPKFYGNVLTTFINTPIATYQQYPYTYTTNGMDISSSGTLTLNSGTLSTSTFNSPIQQGLKTPFDKGILRSKSTLSKQSINETGEIVRGEKSNQEFKTVQGDFQYYPSWSSIWKILPQSQKLHTKEDLKVYCSNCGKKQNKTTDKFCSACGTKF
jgi:hypothetical protein